MIDELKERLADFASQTFTANSLVYRGDQASRLRNLLRGVGYNNTYLVNEIDLNDPSRIIPPNLIRAFDTKSAMWFNLQILGTFTSAEVFLEWSFDNEPTSLWANAIPNANSIGFTEPSSFVMEVRGYSFIRVRIENLQPSNAILTVKVRYT